MRLLFLYLISVQNNYMRLFSKLNNTPRPLKKPEPMKTKKYILTVFVLTSFLFACDKSNEIKYTVKGRLMHDCGVPAANVTDVSFKQHGQPLFGQKGMFLSFNTDAEGYFEVVYNRKDANSLDMEILKNGPILEGIPAMKNLDLGEVFWGTPIFSYVRYLEVNNPYTTNDTLILPDYNTGIGVAKYIAGPFESGVIDTIWNFPYMSKIHFGKTPKYEPYFALTTDNGWRYAEIHLNDLCFEGMYEAVLVLD